jgi:hypothetical protein
MTNEEIALRRVYETARCFISHRERLAATAAGQAAAPRSLAEQIDRDFLAFDVATALDELRKAVMAMEKPADRAA